MSPEVTFRDEVSSIRTSLSLMFISLKADFKKDSTIGIQQKIYFLIIIAIQPFLLFKEIEI